MSQTFVPSSYSGLAADGDLYSGIGTEFSGLVPYGALGFDDAYGRWDWLDRQTSKITRVRKSWRENRAKKHMARYKAKGCDKNPDKTGCGHKKKWAERHLAKAEKMEAKLAKRGHATDIGLSATGEVVQEYGPRSKRIGALASGERLRRRRKGRKGKKGKKGKGRKGKGLMAAEAPMVDEQGEMIYAESPSSMPLILGGILVLALGGGIIYAVKRKKG